MFQIQKSAKNGKSMGPPWPFSPAFLSILLIYVVIQVTMLWSNKVTHQALPIIADFSTAWCWTNQIPSGIQFYIQSVLEVFSP